MNRAVVIYKSKYSTTKKYAQWLAEALGCDLYNAKDFDTQQFPAYDTIVYGGASTRQVSPGFP